jgi:hypothetical protein
MITNLNRIAGELASAVQCYYEYHDLFTQNEPRSLLNSKREVELALLSGTDVREPLEWLLMAVGSEDWDDDIPFTVDVRRAWMQATVMLNEGKVLGDMESHREEYEFDEGQELFGSWMRVPKYAVYHTTSPLAMLRPSPRNWQINRHQHYRHVANVRAERDQIFSLTNHDEMQDWTKRPEVSWVASGLSPRSTSVGDVISDPEMSRAWLVERSGLEEIAPFPL